MAEWARAEEGCVPRVRNMIRQRVHSVDHSPSAAQAKLRLHQRRQDIRAVDDEHWEKMLTFFDDHGVQA